MSLLQDMHNEVQVLTRLAYVDTTTPAMEVLDVREALEEVLEAEPLPFRDPLLLALLVTSSTNLVLVLLYWAYLLYSACSHSSQPSLFPHLLLLGLALGSSSSLAQVTVILIISTLLYPSLCRYGAETDDQYRDPRIDTKIILMGN